jgi:hypothetical protein
MNRLSFDYRFEAPESWSEACLGGRSEASALLNWDEVGAAAPEISNTGPSYHRYLCEWEWRPNGTGNEGQRLTMTIDVRDNHEYGPYDASIAESLGSIDWHTDYESLSEWEHGICRQQFGESATMYQCIASDSNLQLTLASQDLPGSDYDDKHFGPGSVSIEDLTVEVGELVRDAFRA